MLISRIRYIKIPMRPNTAKNVLTGLSVTRIDRLSCRVNDRSGRMREMN